MTRLALRGIRVGGEFGDRTALDDVSPEALHVDVQLAGALAGQFVEAALLVEADLVHGPAAVLVQPLLLVEPNRVTQQEVGHGPAARHLRVLEELADKGSEADALVLAPQPDGR